MMPDWPWAVYEQDGAFCLGLDSPQGAVGLDIEASGEISTSLHNSSFIIARAGSLVYGSGDVKPYWGWFSSTYAQKVPALLVRFQLIGRLPLKFRSEWKLC